LCLLVSAFVFDTFLQLKKPNSNTDFVAETKKFLKKNAKFLSSQLIALALTDLLGISVTATATATPTTMPVWSHSVCVCK